uniref:Guanine nucleotide-binding protein subunit gamma n=1 Tax=Callorhinchus milii TaxID=7868 RepID=A0A4W3IME6_CALMI
ACDQFAPLKMSSKMPDTNNLVQARRLAQQLRTQACIEKVRDSKASADLVCYCEQHNRSLWVSQPQKTSSL